MKNSENIFKKLLLHLNSYFIMNIIMEKLRIEGIFTFKHITETVKIIKLHLMVLHIILGRAYYIIL